MNFDLETLIEIKKSAGVASIKHHLVDLYQVCSNYSPGAKNGPTSGVTCFT